MQKLKVISDTGPIIGLAKIDRLSILKSLFQSVLIPMHVHHELMGKMNEEWENINKALKDFIRTVECPPFSDKIIKALQYLDKGEQEAIALAYSMNSPALLLIDDKRGRNSAKVLGISVSGVVGIVMVAHEKGLVENVFELLREMREKGYWLSDEILESAKRHSYSRPQ